MGCLATRPRVQRARAPFAGGGHARGVQRLPRRVASSFTSQKRMGRGGPARGSVLTSRCPPRLPEPSKAGGTPPWLPLIGDGGVGHASDHLFTWAHATPEYCNLCVSVLPPLPRVPPPHAAPASHATGKARLSRPLAPPPSGCWRGIHNRSVMMVKAVSSLSK